MGITDEFTFDEPPRIGPIKPLLYCVYRMASTTEISRSAGRARYCPPPFHSSAIKEMVVNCSVSEKLVIEHFSRPDYSSSSAAAAPSLSQFVYRRARAP